MEGWGGHTEVEIEGRTEREKNDEKKLRQSGREWDELARGEKVR